MSTLPPPLCILVAGVPRSGSTWAFNAARLLLRDAGVTLHAAWVADRPADDLAVFEHERHVVGAHFEDRAAAAAAGFVDAAGERGAFAAHPRSQDGRARNPTIVVRALPTPTRCAASWRRGESPQRG